MPEPGPATAEYSMTVAAPPPSLHRRLTLDEAADLIRTEAPLVELTLIHTGAYTGPTRGHIVLETAVGLYLLTEKDGLAFIPWSNLAFFRYPSQP
jgi:hypothetical protein